MKLDLDSIRVLNTIIEQGSFSAASKTLHRAQSAVSYQIRKLESTLNLTIFDRTKYRAVLTPEGKAILNEGKRLLTQAENIEILAKQLNQEWEPSFEVVVDGILDIAPIMKVIKALIEEDVPTKISLTMEYLGGVQHRFERNKADLMIVKEFQHTTQLSVKKLPEVECLLCVSSEHSLAKLSNIDKDQLQQHIQLSVHDSSNQENFEVEHMHFGGERLFYLSDFKSKKLALLQGIGFGWMPRYLVSKEIKQSKLHEVNYIADSRFSFHPHLVWRADKSLGKTGKMFMQLLLDSIK
ncbi:MAG: DNA-binding transcriptional LysR family regulator [Polaribacter sp.]|jgi:DNA-binding transcriptional LysR family regulator